MWSDRQANRALHMIAVVRLRFDPRTITYMHRRQTEGLSKKDVLRCLKRFIAREVFTDLTNDLKPYSAKPPQHLGPDRRACADSPTII
jgi:transposase